MPADSGLPRVAWVADRAYPPRSGIGNHVYQLVGGLHDLSVPVSLIHFGKRPPLHAFALPEVSLPLWMGRRVLRRILPALHPGLRGNFDIIHFPTEFDLYYLRPGRAIRVVTIHGCAGALMPENLHHRMGPSLMRRLSKSLAGVDGIATVSASSAREIELVYGVPVERIRIIPNGIGPVFGRASPAEPAWYRERLGTDRPYLLSVGLMIPKKNQLAVLGVLRRLADMGFNHSLVQVGESGPSEPALRRTARELGLEDRFITLGFQGEEDLARLYAGAACLVFPSFHEGFGIPVIEAMAAGCPVVAADIPAIREVTGGEVPLFPPEDVQGMAHEASLLLQQAERRREAISRGRRRATLYSWNRSARELLAWYKELLAEKGREARQAVSDLDPA